MAAPTVASLEAVTHVVQVALTPIFLLSGVAALLNVFASRLARVADRVDRLAETSAANSLVMRRLRQRSRILDAAVVLVSLAGLLTCGAALTLFYGALRARAASDALFAMFAGALVLTMLAILLFAFEMILSGRAVRECASYKIT